MLFDATTAVVFHMTVVEQERIQKEDPILYQLVQGVPWWSLHAPSDDINLAVMRYNRRYGVYSPRAGS